MLVKLIAVTSLLAGMPQMAHRHGLHLDGLPLDGLHLDGVLLASIAPARGAWIALQPAQSAAVTHTGCLLAKSGSFIQQDDDTLEVVELRGPDLGVNVGNRVRVAGRTLAIRPIVPVATTVVEVTSVSPRSQGGCLSVASTLDAEANPPKDAGPVRRKR